MNPGINTSIESVPKTIDLWFTVDMLYVRLEDGREVGVPLECFPKLSKAAAIPQPLGFIASTFN